MSKAAGMAHSSGLGCNRANGVLPEAGLCVGRSQTAQRARSCQNATAAAAATLRESTPRRMGMRDT